MHDRAGQGASAFRAFLRALPDDIARQRDEGFPIVLERDRPLAPHAQRLMDSLGVEVRIVSDVAVDRVRRPPDARTEGHYAVEGDRQPFVENLIDFRHSLVQAAKRADANDETLEICPHCMCEVDVDPQPHRPGCEGIGKPRATSAPVLAALGEAAAVGDSAVSGAAVTSGEPERAAASPSASIQWDRDNVIAAIDSWNAEHGRPPTKREWKQKSDRHPNEYAVKVLFGSWAAAIEAAGFPKPTRGTRAGSVRVARPQPEVAEREEATSEERVTRRTVGAGRGPRSSGAVDETARETTFGLTLEQLTAAGHAIEAVASKLMHLEKPDRRAVWAFIAPLVEEAIDGD